MSNIGIVIVSHSALVAEGTALMARQLAENNIPIAWCGGKLDFGLGSNANAIYEAIKEAWSEDGVAIFVDMGSTEMNSQIAIERFPSSDQKKIMIMNAPLVEGVILAAATSGSSLSEIQQKCL